VEPITVAWQLRAKLTGGDKPAACEYIDGASPSLASTPMNTNFPVMGHCTVHHYPKKHKTDITER